MAGLVQGKIALVTGGGSGIGRATALALAKEEAKVAVSDIVVAGGEETVRLIKAAGGEATFIKADVAKAAEVEALINKAVTNVSVAAALVSTRFTPYKSPHAYKENLRLQEAHRY